MNKKIFMASLILFLFFIPLKINAQPPPFVYRIGGTITINGRAMTDTIFSRFNFSIRVTKDGDIPLVPAAETSELTSSEDYTIDIPVKDDSNPDAATPGEILEIHVYKGDEEVTVTSPVNAEIVMGDGGDSNFNVNISIIAVLPNALPAINLLLLDY